jgi:TPR repeat protein
MAQHYFIDIQKIQATMRPVRLFISVLLLTSLPAFAAKPIAASQTAKAAPNFFRNAPLPKWISPLAAIPAVTLSEPAIVRLAETQAWTGPNSAVLVNRAVQINDKARLGEIGQYGISYYPAYQKLFLHKVAILRGDQVMDRTATVNARLLENEPDIASGFYVGRTSVQLLLDDIRVGDTLQIIYTTEGTNPVFTRHWADDFSWDSVMPIERRLLTIAHPVNQKLQWRELGDAIPHAIMPTTERDGAVERLRFEGKAIAALELEPGVPSSYLPFRMIQTSEYGSWQDVAAWAAGLFTPSPPSPGLNAVVRQLGSTGTEEVKASQALHWVQDEIRYFSVALGENSHRPQPPDAVLKRRFGDCKDKSSLLIAMLAQLGIKSEPVLVSARSPEFPNKLLPSPSWFDHVIVRVRADGKTYYVDPTRESEKGLLSQLTTAMPGAAGLVVATDTMALQLLPDEVTGFPLMESQEKFIVTSLDADVELEVSTRYQGSYARYARTRYAAMSSADLRNSMLGDYDKQFRGATLVGQPKTQDSDDGTTYTVSARLNLPKPVVKDGDTYSLPHKTRIMDGSLGIPDKLARKHPFELPLGQYQARYRLQIVWPETVKLVNAAELKTIDNPFFRAHREYSWRGNEVDYVIDYAVKKKQLAPAELPELEAQSKLLQPWIESSLRLSTTSTVQAGASKVSVRDGAVANAALEVRAIAAELEKNPNQKNSADTVELLCQGVMSMLYVGDIYTSTRPLVIPMLRKLEQIQGLDADRERCGGRIAFRNNAFKPALVRFNKAGEMQDDDVLLLELAWAKLSLGDTAGAVTDTQRFLQARLQTGTLAPDDAALAILLLQRGGHPLPAEMDAYIRAVPDAPWPRPVLAFLTGRIDEDQLLQAANRFASIKRESTVADAWFYIAARRQLAGKKETALQALRWFPIHGIWGTRTNTLAMGELSTLETPDPDLKKGLEASNQKSPDFKTAKEYYLTAAARGSASAEMELGFLAENGKLGKVDDDEAFKWYQRSAQHGDLNGMNYLALSYDEGRGVEKNETLAVEWFQRAAAQGHYYASRNLGKRYRRGEAGLPVDAKLAFKHYYDAAQLGNEEAQGVISEMYFNGEGVEVDLTLSAYWASRSAELGDAGGMAQLAFLLAYGHGVEKDQKMALALWHKAANKGSAAAQVQLGNAYQNGLGVQADSGIAFEWFSKAAAQGNVHALSEIGYAYLWGRGVNASYKKARAIFEEVVKTGVNVRNAYYWLGWMEDRGVDAPANYTTAHRYFTSCAELGDARCQFLLGLYLHYGRNGITDYAGAINWYTQAAEQGDAGAINNLADMHEKGTGVPVDLPLAINMYRQAALKGDLTSLYSLGTLYERGLGVRADPYLAYLYYEMAIKETRFDANAWRARLTPLLSEEQLASARAAAKAWTPTQPFPGDAAVALNAVK